MGSWLFSTSDLCSNSPGSGIDPLMGMTSTARHCLVVDDSKVTRRVTKETLQRAGLRVSEAANGLEALMSCREALPDCVLLDWNMPVMNGIECLDALRSEFGPDKPIVILCTIESEIGFIVRAVESGAQEYVMKPFNDEILLGKFSQLRLL